MAQEGLSPSVENPLEFVDTDVMLVEILRRYVNSNEAFVYGKSSADRGCNIGTFTLLWEGNRIEALGLAELLKSRIHYQLQLSMDRKDRTVEDGDTGD